MPVAAIPVITAVATVAGTAMSLVGQQKQSSAASNIAAQNERIANDELQAEKIRQQAAEADARRRQLEQIRTMNRARAMALSNASASGAQFSSGLAGAYGSVSGSVNNNLAGIQQNLGFGEQMFGVNSDISQARIATAGYSGDYYAGAGLSSLGNTMVTQGPALGKSLTDLSGFFKGLA